MIRACHHHDYAENHLNTIFYDGLNDSTKALLDLAVGGQLSKLRLRSKRLLRITLGEEQGVVDYLGA